MAKKQSSPAPAPPVETEEKKKKTKKFKNQPLTLAPEQRTQNRQAVAGSASWTGKLPATLLNEYCQKQKWNRVEYDMKKVASGGLCAVAILSWKNPKTNEVITVRLGIPNDSTTVKPAKGKPAERSQKLIDEISKGEETPVEARNIAATIALHRVASDKNLHIVLPNHHKSLWKLLEEERKRLLRMDGEEKCKMAFNSEPFNVVLEKRKFFDNLNKEKESKQRELEKTSKPAIAIGVVSNKNNNSNNNGEMKTNKYSISENNSNNTKLSTTNKENKETDKRLLNQVSFPKKVWDSTVFIDLDSEIRKSIEDSIRNHITWSEDSLVSASSSTPAAIESYVSTLKGLGFRDTHIEESTKYTSTFTDSLEWLIFHIPEDDLPARFVKDNKVSNIQLKISKDLKKEYMIERLLEGGFSKNQVIDGLNVCSKDEIVTAVYLTRNLITTPISFDIEEPESLDIWKEEVCSLKAIYNDDEKIKVNQNEKIIEIKLSPEGIQSDLLFLRVYKSENYPQDIPGLHLIVKNQSYRLANYIRVSIITHLLKFIINDGLLGMSFLYSCIEWLETNISSIVANPGPLFDVDSIKPKQIGNGNANSSSSSKSMNTKPGTKRKFRSDNDIKQMSEAYNRRLNSKDLKNSVERRSKLPAWGKKDELVEIINSNRVCLITGETGSGKSTQIVQFILDNLNAKGDFKTNIICTQPRRISTIGLAERISEERVDKVGVETGYVIRGENKTGKFTRLSFVTTGVLLRMIQSLIGTQSNESDEVFFENLGYIFIDEVHERSVDSDFLLIILKKIMNKFPNLKIVLMSATIDINIFKNYFDSKSISHSHIDGRTFPIKDYYLDTCLEDLDFKFTNYDGEIIRPKADSKFFQLGNINYDLISQLVLKINTRLNADSNTGSILIFLPGVMEISKCIKAIRNSSDDYWLLPLHSTLSSADQKRIFNNPPRGLRKVICSTNIAETSITIPDTVVVIDSGKVKNIYYDAKLNSTKLTEGWASKAESKQRRGRAGRIQAGYCYKLFTQTTESESMLKHPIPEIQRVQLENIYLVVKAMGISNVFEFLKMGLDHPDIEAINNSKLNLIEIGALNNKDELTSLGNYLSLLPTDLKSGKLLIFGTLFGCLESCLTLASIGITGNPFIINTDNRDKVKRIQNSFSKNQGDLIAILNAFNEYNKLETSKERSNFLNDNSLSYLKMNDIKATRIQYISNLKDLGFIPLNYSSNSISKQLNRNSSNYKILNALITSSAYPNIARIQLPDPKYLASSVGSIQLDPDARKIKIWIRNEEYIKSKLSPFSRSKNAQSQLLPSTRAFLHPSSTFFNPKNPNNEVTTDDVIIDQEDNYIFKPHIGNPSSSSSTTSTLTSSFISYNMSNVSSKLYLREITPTSIISILLFGGVISYDLSNGDVSPGIVIDGWLPIKTWCKNGVLIKKLRVLLDNALKERLSKPLYQSNVDDDVGTGGDGNDVLVTVEKLLTKEFK